MSGISGSSIGMVLCNTHTIPAAQSPDIEQGFQRFVRRVGGLLEEVLGRRGFSPAVARNRVPGRRRPELDRPATPLLRSHVVMHVIAGFLAVLLSTLSAEAVWVELTPEQTQQALAHGKATFERWNAERKPIDDLDPEYVVDLGRDVGQAMLQTEFSTLALQTRRWEAIGQQLKPQDIEQLLGLARGRLRFLVILVGGNRDFLRNYTVRLLQGGVSREPAGWEIFRGEPLANTPGRYQASGQYSFRVKDIDPTAPVTLLVRDPGGQELRFDFDLSRLR